MVSTGVDSRDGNSVGDDRPKIPQGITWMTKQIKVNANDEVYALAA